MNGPPFPRSICYSNRSTPPRTVRRVGPDPARGVGLVEHSFAQARALVGGGGCRTPAGDQTELGVNRDVVLMAERGNSDVDPRQ
jgi:hypothetical protein